MTPYDYARSRVGLKETPGPLHNDEIIAMFAKVGHSWVKDDETAWCSAFRGWAEEMAGGKSTRKLDARSWLKWGKPVDISEAIAGDTVIFWRGKPGGWQGHVGFFVRNDGDNIVVLGGNQGNAVSEASYPASRLLGVRRASAKSAAAPENIAATGAGLSIAALAAYGNYWPVVAALCAAVAALIIWKRVKR